MKFQVVCDECGNHIIDDDFGKEIVICNECGKEIVVDENELFELIEPIFEIQNHPDESGTD